MSVVEITVGFVLSRSVGEYSDRSVDPFGIVWDEDTAKRLVTLADQEWRGAIALNPKPPYPDIDVEAVSDGEYGQILAKHELDCARHLEGVRALLSVDPDAAEECEYDPPYYFYRRVPVLDASAIEAATAAETPQDGSVHESATRQGDAQ